MHLEVFTPALFKPAYVISNYDLLQAMRKPPGAPQRAWKWLLEALWKRPH